MKVITFAYPLIGFVIMLSGCATNQAGEDPNVNREALDPPRDQTVDEDISSRLGYVKYSQDQINQEERKSPPLVVNRDKLADAISRLILYNNDFENVATLVTDHEILIAYDRPDNMDPDDAASIVRETALSVIPRYYHVYVSDEPVTFRDIQSLQNSTTKDDDYKNTLNTIIKEMKKSPQGIRDNNNEDMGE